MKQIEILDQNFDPIYIMDSYESLIWTDRYNTPGDFELLVPAYQEALQFFKRDFYVRMSNSDRLMIIEDIVYQSSPYDTGNHVKITGRSLESILERRIIWGTVNTLGIMQDEVEKLFNDNIIRPTDADRIISNFIFEKTDNADITKLILASEYTGDSLLEIIQTISAEYDIGWKIILNDENQFVFSFYTGVDRTFDQDVYQRVVFSPEYENVIESNFTVSGTGIKNTVLVEGCDEKDLPKDEDEEEEEESEGGTSGEGEEEEKKPYYMTVGGGIGLNRREMYSNQSGVTPAEGESLDDYNSKLRQAGFEELNKYMLIEKFDGQYDTRSLFVYGRDFYIGDKVEVADEFGNHSSSRVTEFIWSDNTSNGEEAYPTFSPIDANVGTPYYVYNPYSYDIGFTMVISSSFLTTNPTIKDVTTDESMRFDTAKIQVHTGTIFGKGSQIVYISQSANKSIWLKVGEDIYPITSILDDVKWFTLKPGLNEFLSTAEFGNEYVSITFIKEG